ncbi:MAG: ATP-binding protein [Candidatus Aeolococcus gillhamiae]|uniref:ATP-binding protein n=1 Tax=Candidatus Aeolococcus gillhamiae TaxID=3127015 RepID=A0A2W5Z0C0_9BACT|nr:MAG: ATP-binding protein [Candidatus Dormibacter sp. RRmetagenome_bin12]
MVTILGRLARAPAHRATTAQLQSVYPAIARGDSVGRGVCIGRHVHGGFFTYDPWELYATGALTNPNMLILGQLGRGKSALQKCYVLRQLVFGRHALMLDPKGENGALCAAAGCTPIALRPDGDIRLNPLELGDADAGDAGARLQERVRVLAALLGASLGRSLTSEDRLAVELAIDAASQWTRGQAPTLRAVVEAMLAPAEEAARAAWSSVDQLAATSRGVALELRRLVNGDLRGMFDGPTSEGIDLTAPVVSFDLSAVYGSSAQAILMACVDAWFRSVLGRRDAVKRIVVLDEAWALLRNLETARSLAASYKLARWSGVQYLAVLHRLTDIDAAGSAGSEQVSLAQGLLRDSGTVVVYGGQSAAEVAVSRELLGLNDIEADLLPGLPRGRALWRLGDRSFLVDHLVGRDERAVIDSDAQMRIGSAVAS